MLTIDCILFTPSYKMVVICFPGGAGGHYVGYLIHHLLTQTTCESLPQFNFHQLSPYNRSFLNFSFLDHSGHSQQEELSYIQQICSGDQLVIGHFRNVSAIYQQHKAKIVCIHVGNNTKDLLVNRVLKEAIDLNFDQVKYNDIRGSAWPEQNPGYDQLPKWIQLEIQSMLYRMFEYWNDQFDMTQVDPDHICRISSDDIFNGDIINSLTALLKCDTVPGIRETQQQYQQLVREKYNRLF
jgi:hypothetical protein